MDNIQNCNNINIKLYLNILIFQNIGPMLSCSFSQEGQWSLISRKLKFFINKQAQLSQSDEDVWESRGKFTNSKLNIWQVLHLLELSGRTASLELRL
jgi:hypothetical protein